MEFHETKVSKKKQQWYSQNNLRYESDYGKQNDDRSDFPGMSGGGIVE